MTIALSTNNKPSLIPSQTEMTQLIEIGRVLGTCPFYQKIGAGGVLTIWLTARELGLPPMMCLNGGLYTFDGKVTLSAQLMNMMIVNAGHRADILELNDKTCRLRFCRKDRQKGQGDTFDYEFNIDMAAKAGYLTKANWKTNPRDMLFSRALSGGARKFMPDVLMNCYVFGEIENIDEHLTNTVPDIAVAPVVTEPPKQIEHVKCDGFDVFVQKYTEKYGEYITDYVKESGKKAGVNEIQVWNSAIRHENLFVDRFEKWMEKATLPEEKPRSMDELV